MYSYLFVLTYLLMQHARITKKKNVICFMYTIVLCVFQTLNVAISARKAQFWQPWICIVYVRHYVNKQ